MVGEADNNFRLIWSPDPFDCSGDPCHLAWVIRDNRDLLEKIKGDPRCSNGTLIANLDPKGFDQCPET